MFKKYYVLMLGVLAMSAVSEPVPEIRKLTLSNGEIELGVSPDIGGRVLHASVAGMRNILAVDEKLLAAGRPEVSLSTSHKGYMGHVIWHGPQSQWWTQQTLHKQRKANQAIWPPDPFTVFASNTILEQQSDRLSLLSEVSPVTGLQVRKTFELAKNKGTSVQLKVAATNKRVGENVSWDIWFNTRVPADTAVYVPVTNRETVRFQPAFNPNTQENINFKMADGLVQLEKLAASTAEKMRVGKLYVYPSQGWLAAFNHGQMLLIEFEHVPQAAIHPEQGLVELYMEYAGDDYAAGIIELEVHSPLHDLKPGDTMTANERWHIVRYKGKNTAAAQRAFLHQFLDTLN